LSKVNITTGATVLGGTEDETHCSTIGTGGGAGGGIVDFSGESGSVHAPTTTSPMTKAARIGQA
jgi:hypothetical protein